ncbi:MAG: double-strand break repair helicase AddA [Pseudomonadota bacterium]
MRDAATQRQVDAANPNLSTWLSANAGSGKTRVLTDRVARLLLEEVAPQNILCLTYTKAAAAEMQNRLFKRLGAWAMMGDGDLRKELAELGIDATLNAAKLRQARTLFARAIETPGGLKIQTIHAFCAGILRRFPLEAKVSPQFREIEDREATRLRADVVDQMLMGPDAGAVHDLLAYFTGADLASLTAEVVRQRQHFFAPFDAAKLRDYLHIPADLDLAKLQEEVFDRALLTQLATLCRSGTSTDAKLADALAKLLRANPSPSEVLETLEGLFLTKSGNAPFTAKIGKLPTKGTRAQAPDLMADLDVLMGRVEDIRPLRLGQLAFDRTQALYHFGTAFTPAYEARKQAMGVLDFDDLIEKARALLTDPTVAQWVLFRLDGGIDHVLIDEAQDTSPGQWAVIEQLTQDFASGEGARADRLRTVFVVGDKKQSIYSFQGADPAEFDRMQAHFDDAQRAIGKPLQVTTLDHSFRSSQAVLSVVDAVLGQKSVPDISPSHIAFHDAMPGRVDLWEPIEADAPGDDLPWFAPVDSPSPADHTVLLARQIADQIQHMVAHDTLTVWDKDSKTFVRRAVTPGDFLILVQRRSALFAEIIRACKAAGLEIAGADRLRVGAELAVKDLAALLRFVALPEDDLSLAAALRSPLFGWSEQDLFTLAHHRGEKEYLWTALRGSDHTETLTVLNDLRQQADFFRPYDLIARILTRHDGRRKLLARLGPEAEDGIDALLTQALQYETAEVPSLTGFLAWMDADELEIKRQMDNQGDQIRVMTVHGAKGLEAPIVILPDTAKRQETLRDEVLADGDQVIWKAAAADIPPVVANLIDGIKAKRAEERDRLLYVAMTRAENWLIVAASGDLGKPGESWYNQMAEAMAARGDVAATHGPLTVRRVETHDWNAAPMKTVAPAETPSVLPPRLDPLPEATRHVTLSPSEFPGPKALAGETDALSEEDAKARGVLIHSLLEHLPQVPADQRLALGARIVGDAQDDLVQQTIALLETDHLSHLWGPDALTEVAVTADVAGIGRIHGAIDRLLITDEIITIIDYKSNRVVPPSADAIPEGIVNQLAIYHAAVAKIYPDMPIAAAILWTETATLMPLPDAQLHEALRRLSVP